MGWRELKDEEMDVNNEEEEEEDEDKRSELNDNRITSAIEHTQREIDKTEIKIRLCKCYINGKGRQLDAMEDSSLSLSGDGTVCEDLERESYRERFV